MEKQGWVVTGVMRINSSRKEAFEKAEKLKELGFSVFITRSNKTRRKEGGKREHLLLLSTNRGTKSSP